MNRTNSLPRLLFCFVLALLWGFPAGLWAQEKDRRGPFTHDLRSVRSRDIDQQHLRIELRFDWDKKYVEGRTTLTFTPYKPLGTLVLDAAEMEIQEVRLLGDQPRSLEHQQRDDQLEIQLGETYQPDDTLKVEIAYTLTDPKHGVHFVVPTESEPQQDRMLWTQNEPEYARYWIPCIDTPADRVSSEIIATVPKEYFVLSNGILREQIPQEDGTQRWHWVQEKNHVPYLISIVAGTFATYEQSWQGMPVNAYVPPSRIDDAERSFAKTTAMLDYFVQQIGTPFPWEKYAQICVEEYHWGGMEHTSATTLNVNTLHDERAHLDVSSDNLVAHELAHQWYGDLLTCKDWGEIWLNESFATYFATLWTEHDGGWDEAAWERHEEAQSYLREDQRYRRSIVNYHYASPEYVFDRHSYPKGGRVLHMLRFVLGDDLFWKAIQHYTKQNAFRTVETADFRVAIEEATGQGLNWFFDQWIHHGGHPEFKVQWRWDEQSKLAIITVKQTQKVDAITPLFRTPVEIELAWTDGTQKIHRIEVSKESEVFQLSAERRPEWICFDPNDWILKTLEFEQGKDQWLRQLAHDSHVMCRARAADALAEMVQDGDVADALAAAAADDSFWAVRQQAVKALGKASGDAARQTLLKVARQDKKSFVRRTAIEALAKFQHEETSKALREIIEQDRSYYAIAEAIEALVEVDPDQSTDVVLAALDQPSHQEVILRAACNGLAKVNAQGGAEKLTEMLKQSQPPERRVLLVGTLARIKTGDPQVMQVLFEQLESAHLAVRRTAIDALVDVGDPQAIGVLLEQRGREENPRMIQRMDEAIEELQGKNANVAQLRRELEELRQENQELEQRLEKLEKQLPH